MSAGSNLTQYYLQVHALTPQSGAPDVAPTLLSGPPTFPFGITIIQLAIFSILAIIGIMALLAVKVHDLNKIILVLTIMFITSAVPVSVMVVNRRTQIESLAGPDPTPKNVIVSQVKNTGFSVLWDTDKPNIGVIRYRLKDDPVNFSRIVSEEEEGQIYRHVLVITDLKPQTPYVFEILSDGTWYDDRGQPLEVLLPP